MEYRDYNHYEANAGDVRLDDITSSPWNATILQRLRDGDDTLQHIVISRYQIAEYDFAIRESDDLGWLGYFIGSNEHLRRLSIWYLPGGEGGEQQTRAFLGGIARNQSIRRLYFQPDFRLDVHNLSDDMLVAVAGSLSQLEDLALHCRNFGPHGCSALGTVLETEGCKLKKLCIRGSIGDDGAAALTKGLASIGSSLKELHLSQNNIGNGGWSALVAALATCTSLETLDISRNDFSSAAAGMRSLFDWLQRAPMTLKHMRFEECGINDEGVQALVGAANHCETLNLSGNGSITVSGLRCLSTLLQSESCRVETLNVQWMPIGDDGAKVLALGLVGNTSLRSLHCDSIDVFTPAGLSAFSTALCDTSSVNNTYHSNHTLRKLWNIQFTPDDIDLLLRLNKEHPQHAAKCKILMKHHYLDMVPFFQWKLKFLPLALDWFERASSCMTLSIYDNNNLDLSRRVLEESDEAFQSRKLTAMYQFVRGMPMEVMKRREALAAHPVNGAFGGGNQDVEFENDADRDLPIQLLEAEFNAHPDGSGVGVVDPIDNVLAVNDDHNELGGADGGILIKPKNTLSMVLSFIIWRGEIEMILILMGVVLVWWWIP